MKEKQEKINYNELKKLKDLLSKEYRIITHFRILVLINADTLNPHVQFATGEKSIKDHSQFSIRIGNFSVYDYINYFAIDNEL